MHIVEGQGMDCLSGLCCHIGKEESMKTKGQIYLSSLFLTNVKIFLFVIILDSM